MSSTINLPDWPNPVEIDLTHDLSQDELLSFPAFKTWASTLQRSLALQRKESHPFNRSPYTLRKIKVQAIDRFSHNRIGFIKLAADVSNDNGEKLPGSVFLRGGSVAVLLILRPQGSETLEEKSAILTVQPRIPGGSLSFAEIPAGMLDDSGTFAGGAAKEIQEETGLTIPEKDLVNLTQLATQAIGIPQDTESLQEAVYPSPGGSDEFIPIFLCEKEFPREEIDGMQGRLTGLRGQGEKITLKIVPLKDLWKEGARDGKTLAALALYENLKRDGKV